MYTPRWTEYRLLQKWSNFFSICEILLWYPEIFKGTQKYSIDTPAYQVYTADEEILTGLNVKGQPIWFGTWFSLESRQVFSVVSSLIESRLPCNKAWLALHLNTLDLEFKSHLLCNERLDSSNRRAIRSIIKEIVIQRSGGLLHTQVFK